MRLRRTVIATGAGLALACAASGCGAAHGARAPAATRDPIEQVVRVGPAFTPNRVRLTVGASFRVVPARGVRVSGDLAPGSCRTGSTAPARPAPLLEKRCAQGGVVLTALRRGSMTLMASVSPRCAPRKMCPMWVAMPRLSVTVG